MIEFKIPFATTFVILSKKGSFFFLGMLSLGTKDRYFSVNVDDAAPVFSS